MTVTQGILNWAVIASMLAGSIGGAQTTDQTVDDLPDYDFSGKEFRILNGAATGETSFWWADEVNGEVVNDAVYHRNKGLSERFNVKITEQRLVEGDPVQFIMSSVMAADSAFEIADIDISASSQLMLDGYFMNLYDIPYIDFSKDYWDIELMGDLAFGDKLYYALNAANLDSYESTHLLAFNKDIEEKYGVSRLMRYDSLYQIVLDGEWTLDRFYEAAIGATFDMNGDTMMTGSDSYGYLAPESDMLAGMYIGADEVTISRGDDGRFAFALNGNDRFAELFSLLKTELVNDYCWYDGDKAALLDMYKNNQGLFVDITLGDVRNMRDFTADFGFLPYPKLDEKQPDYVSRVESCNATIVPVSCADVEFVGIMLEAFASHSYAETLPAYYDVALKMKYTRDEPSSEMLDIVTNSRRFDLGDAVYGSLVRDKLCETLRSDECADLDAALAVFGEKVEMYIGKVNDIMVEMQ